MRTSDLTGPALDWAVAKCEGYAGVALQERTGTDWYTPSSDWSQGGPIIERYGVELRYRGVWQASFCFDNPIVEHYLGPTPLIAAMRCYVASRLGDTIDIPEELL